MAATSRLHKSAGTLEILDLRHFTSAELRPLLEEEARAWAKVLSWDYASSSEMILRYVDAKVLPGYAAVENGRLRGYSFFVYEQNKGVIGDLFASAVLNGRSGVVEERLLNHVIETLQQSPGIHRIEAQLLIHDSDVVAGPFLGAGFDRYRRLFMLWPLRGAGRPPLTIPPPAGIEIRRWSEQDFNATAAVITAAYQSHVDAAINDQYRTVGGSLRFLNNIIRFPGCGIFDGDSSFVAVTPTRQIVGAILCSRVRSDVGHVTQVCVTPEFRGKKIGAALLASAAAALRRHNFSAMSLTVTEANAGAVDLYERLGFTTRRVFDAFVWEG
ncbi:MAG TPA: GNAT family N-acetyltransferase [Terriglobales bacterium]|nr:GNAT family N-acetyltransferase [Terriglobales bacterium]